MNTQQMKVFVAIAENKNITQAAGKLFLSQPALSRQLTLLEEELGCQLVVRNNHGVDLTPAGEVLYKRSKKIQEDLLNTVEAVREAASGVHGQINVGTIYTDFPHLIPYLADFRKQYPHIMIRITPQVPSQLLEQLAQGTVHVVCLRLPMSDVKNWPYIPLNKEKSMLAIHETMDPCPDQKEIPIELLRGIPFCSGTNVDRERHIWDYANLLQEECRLHGFELNMAFECSGVMSRIMLTSAGLAACFIPAEITKLFDCRRIHLKEIAGVTVETIPIIAWNDRTYMSRPLQLFLEYFHKLQAGREE
ncbi:LysR family transcriptional regulator [uncultured Clostridium sp.]|uniref:LysR family transcriptional regulator n=1 Tax=uncultured Clostridium sp. TaxID=59620 RepID=UPI0025DF0B9D|nr:LysR family transcriptional regulator [uncultured Clostridium sp.]